MMKRTKDKLVHYYVEGECEEKLVRALIDDYKLLPPGKVKTLNVKQKRIPKSLLLNIKPGSYVVFIFDTDVDSYSFLIANRKALEDLKLKIQILMILQVQNLEDELTNSCRIKHIRELTHSRSDKDFKRDFIKASNVAALLEQSEFNFSLLWNQDMPYSLKDYDNGKNTLCR